MLGNRSKSQFVVGLSLFKLDNQPEEVNLKAALARGLVDKAIQLDWHQKVHGARFLDFL